MQIPVSFLVNLVANGMQPEEILAEYPFLEKEDVRQALRYAASLANEEIHPEVSRISGLIPPDVDAEAEYRDHLLAKHR